MSALQVNITRPPTDSPSSADHRRRIADSVWQIIDKISTVGTVTLTANVATTVISDLRISADAIAIFAAQTANAAAEIGNGTMYYSAASGAVTITHANNAQTDRTFGYFIFTP